MNKFFFVALTYFAATSSELTAQEAAIKKQSLFPGACFSVAGHTVEIAYLSCQDEDLMPILISGADSLKGRLVEPGERICLPALIPEVEMLSNPSQATINVFYRHLAENEKQ
jgi:hypothetical protein